MRDHNDKLSGEAFGAEGMNRGVPCGSMHNPIYCVHAAAGSWGSQILSTVVSLDGS